MKVKKTKEPHKLETRIENKEEYRHLDKLVIYPYGVSHAVGRRPYMEDRHLIKGNLSGRSDASFYAIFDGHGGSRAAEFCVARMATHLVSHVPFVTRPVSALTHAFVKTDEEFLSVAKSSFRPMDDGTTATAALVLGNKIWVANAGDSRCILVQSDGGTHALSEDHKPDRPDETQRIRAAGGAVLYHGVWRVQGILAVSRAIGDRPLKAYVTSKPEVRAWTIRENEDAFLILGTDGLWDVVDHAEAAKTCLDANDAAEASRRLVSLSISRGALDNVTAIVVDLRKPSMSLQTPPISTENSTSSSNNHGDSRNATNGSGATPSKRSDNAATGTGTRGNNGSINTASNVISATGTDSNSISDTSSTSDEQTAADNNIDTSNTDGSDNPSYQQENDEHQEQKQKEVDEESNSDDNNANTTTLRLSLIHI